MDKALKEIKEFKSFIKTVREGECWPAVPTIAREIQLSEKTVRRAILDLCKAKILETEQRYRTKGGKSSLLFKLS